MFVFACVCLGWFGLSVRETVVVVVCLCFFSSLDVLACLRLSGLVCVECACASLYNNMVALRCC